MRPWSALTLPVAVVLVLAGCGFGGADAAPSGGSDDGDLSGALTVFAASSLTDVFTLLGNELTAANPGLEVRISFAGSSALATQIVQGAPADVFASANEQQMEEVAGEDLVAGSPEVFTSNVMQIAVPAGNPAGVTGLDDFTRSDLALALCFTPAPFPSGARRLEAG